MAPSPSYLPTALPKSVHSRATHDGEGAVATANPQMQSEIANSQLPTIRRHLHLSTSTRLRPFPTTARAPSPRTGGRNKCDPPASASGRRGLRPSRDTWRWRPRHRICQPHSRNQSIPAQRTTARAPSLRGQTTHDTLYQLSSTYYHLHLNTSTRPFFKSLNAPIPKCNRKSKIINLKFFASASREI